MRAFKVEHFKRAHPNQSFPTVTAVNSDEVEQFRRGLCAREQLPQEMAWREILARALGRAEPVPSVSAEAEGFELAAIVDGLGIMPAAQVYLGWDLLGGELDRLAFMDLARWFEWLWYPSSDDLVIFDASLAWLLVVDHEGQVACVRLGV